MKYLLDTNICIYYLKNTYPSVMQHFAQNMPEDMALCAIVKSELWYGALRSNAVERNLDNLQYFIDLFETLPFDDEAAWHAANIRANLANKGTPIGFHDVQIAAIALANDLSVVTNNVREFARVDGLRVENWLA